MGDCHVWDENLDELNRYTKQILVKRSLVKLFLCSFSKRYLHGLQSHPSIFSSSQCPKHLLLFEDAPCFWCVYARQTEKKRKVIKEAVWLNKGAHYVCYFCSSNVCLPLFPLRFTEKPDNQGWGLLSASIRQINQAGDAQRGKHRGKIALKASWFSTSSVCVCTHHQKSVSWGTVPKKDFF